MVRALLLLAVPLYAQAPALPIDFDAGVRSAAVSAALAEPDPSAPAPEPEGGKAAEVSRDCVPIAFGRKDGPVSPPVELRSEVFESRCEEHRGGTRCWTRLLRAVSRSVVLSLQGDRAPLPWEVEVFMACLEDERLTVDVVRASHEYRLTHQPGPEAYVVEARALRKLPTEPDPRGIRVDSFYPTPGAGLLLSLRDKWAAQYSGERTGIRLTVKSEARRRPDRVVCRSVLELPAAPIYRIPIPSVAGCRPALTPGERYYAEWGFERLGEVSLPGVHPRGRTAPVAAGIP